MDLLLRAFSGGANLLLLSWAVWIAAAVVLNLVKPWQSYLPAVLSDMLAYGKLKNDFADPVNPRSRSPISRFIFNDKF